MTRRRSNEDRRKDTLPLRQDMEDRRKGARRTKERRVESGEKTPEVDRRHE